MEKITEIVHRTRNTGNTTWILKAAIKQPNCIIVSKSKRDAEYLEWKYFQILSKSAWYKKLWWKWFGRKHPKFLSLYNDFRGLGLPVIFDNGALCDDIIQFSQN